MEALRRTGGSETTATVFRRNRGALRRTGGSEKHEHLAGALTCALRRTGGSEIGIDLSHTL